MLSKWYADIVSPNNWIKSNWIWNLYKHAFQKRGKEAEKDYTALNHIQIDVESVNVLLIRVCALKRESHRTYCSMRFEMPERCWSRVGDESGIPSSSNALRNLSRVFYRRPKSRLLNQIMRKGSKRDSRRFLNVKLWLHSISLIPRLLSSLEERITIGYGRIVLLVGSPWSCRTAVHVLLKRFVILMLHAIHNCCLGSHRKSYFYDGIVRRILSIKGLLLDLSQVQEWRAYIRGYVIPL